MASPSPQGSSGSPPGKPPKIGQREFQVSIGVLLGLALVCACGRFIARLQRFHRVFLDDIFFFWAIGSLIAGTGLLYEDCPLIYLQENVEAGLQQAPSNIVDQLIRSLKLQTSATVLLTSAIFSIKFSFLCFFRQLIEKQRALIIWWWVVVVISIPAAFVMMFSDFIACSYFDQRVFTQCVTPSALSRQNAVLKASVSLDIMTDAFIISIPVLLLWNIAISLRRKLALLAILCLSILMIAIAIVRITAGKLPMNQVDASWVIFWLQAEACVALMVASVSAFRALFIARKESKYREKRDKMTSTYRSSEKYRPQNSSLQKIANRSDSRSTAASSKWLLGSQSGSLWSRLGTSLRTNGRRATVGMYSNTSLYAARQGPKTSLDSGSDPSTYVEEKPSALGFSKSTRDKELPAAPCPTFDKRHIYIEPARCAAPRETAGIHCQRPWDIEAPMKLPIQGTRATFARSNVEGLAR